MSSPSIENRSAVVLASGNRHKCREFGGLLPNWGIKEAQPFTCEENAATYLGNALLKAQAVRKAQKNDWILADDSGLEVLALGRRPGIHSARYGLSPERSSISSAEQNALLLEELGDVSDRRARFICCLVLLNPKGKLYAVQACVNGLITTEPRSRQEEPFGYDPIFELPPDSAYAGQSFAELDGSLKQNLSHRFLACRELQALMASQFPFPFQT
ncbi:non-canonical purine NTP pyrophosphatase [Candidatus Haliotispira prima]|uniref:Non-canonical purine NTP pyrophosphatase n=1 Tax=Candidatus Haliotispira prima TaxID=3034016 RepID=A0ABY8MHY8_9SPIO|nr:non-canonical purine NTP pyrophosphatase [Candidatus Haliotispira prima]